MGTIGSERLSRRPDDRPIHRIRAGQVIRHREVGRHSSAASPEGPGFLFCSQIKMGLSESRRGDCDQPPHRFHGAIYGSCSASARVPDALQRATLLRRAGTQEATHSAATWAPALQRTANKRCAASGVREHYGGSSCFHIVIASVAKQSRIPPRKDSGLLRCARNDGTRLLPHPLHKMRARG